MSFVGYRSRMSLLWFVLAIPYHSNKKGINLLKAFWISINLWSLRSAAAVRRQVLCVPIVSSTQIWQLCRKKLHEALVFIHTLEIGKLLIIQKAHIFRSWQFRLKSRRGKAISTTRRIPCFMCSHKPPFSEFKYQSTRYTLSKRATQHIQVMHCFRD